MNDILRTLMRSAVFLALRNVLRGSRWGSVAAALAFGALYLFLGGHRAHANMIDDPVGNISGDCVGGFSCSGGDPVECAIAVAQESIACMHTKTEKSVADILTEAGLDKQLSDVTTSEERVVSLGNIAAGGHGSCPSSFSWSAMGVGGSIDPAAVCQLAEWMGWCVLVSAVVMAAKILGGV